jgi:hypothetical protein
MYEKGSRSFLSPPAQAAGITPALDPEKIEATFYLLDLGRLECHQSKMIKTLMCIPRLEANRSDCSNNDSFG